LRSSPAHEHLLVDGVERRRSGDPAQLRRAEEERAGRVRQQEDDHVDEGGKRQREHVTAGRRREELGERDHQVFWPEAARST
jgi:hypothetical protein